MFHLITGGSGSGKSAYAEQQVLQAGPGRRVYIATMVPYGEEGRARVKRHRELRAEKQFETVECYTGLYNLAAAGRFPPSFSETEQCENQAAELKPPRKVCAAPPRFLFQKDDIVLLECMSNLVANEMFEPDGAGEDTVRAVLSGVEALKKQVRHFFIVTNEVFSDGIAYAPETLRYMEYLGAVNCALARCADAVTEVVYGIPVRIAPFDDRIRANPSKRI